MRAGRRFAGLGAHSKRMASPLDCKISRSAGRLPPQDSVLPDGVQGPEPVFPADLLALFVRAAEVVDGHLEHPNVGAADAGGELGLDAEAVFAQLERLNDF